MQVYMAAAESGEGGGALFTIPGLGLEVTGAVTTMWAIMAVLVVFAWMVARQLERVPRSRLQCLVELAVDGGLDFLSGIFGSREKVAAFLPLVGSYFLFILVSNYSGLIPGAGHITGFVPPTSHWGVTAGLAVTVFFSIHYVGIRKKKLRYFKHFVEPVFLAPLMLPLTILEELIKPFSLSLRLFANIYGGETVLVALLMAVPYFLPISTLFLEMIFGFVQAFIFTLLTSIYIASATAEEHH